MQLFIFYNNPVLPLCHFPILSNNHPLISFFIISISIVGIGVVKNYEKAMCIHVTVSLQASETSVSLFFVSEMIFLQNLY